MNPFFLTLDDSNAAAQCADAVLDGKVLCVPTDTVYGLVCSPCHRDAIDRIVAIKKRSIDKPFALFVSSWERLAVEKINASPVAEFFARKFWPGALTLLLSAEKECPCAYRGLVGARCPNHPFLLDLLDKCSCILENTRLNRSGEPGVWSLDDAGSLLTEVDVIVEAGTLLKRPASTVVDCSQNPPRIVREGGVSSRAILSVLEDFSPGNSESA